VAVFIWEINLIILLNVAWSIWRDLQANHFFILLRDESADSAGSAFAGRCLRLCRHWLLLRVTTESRFSLSAAPALSTRLLAGLFLRRPKPFHAELVADFCSKQFHSIDSTNSNMQNCLSSDHQVSPSLFSVSYNAYLTWKFLVQPLQKLQIRIRADRKGARVGLKVCEGLRLELTLRY
jgi:hypothetical protein